MWTKITGWWVKIFSLLSKLFSSDLAVAQTSFCTAKLEGSGSDPHTLHYITSSLYSSLRVLLHHPAWDSVSAPRRLCPGVPQGSMLGLFMFSLHSCALSQVISSHVFSYHCYADDSQLILFFSRTDVHVSVRICAWLADIWSRMEVHQLKLTVVYPWRCKSTSRLCDVSCAFSDQTTWQCLEARGNSTQPTIFLASHY